MNLKLTRFKKWDNWYDKQYTGKETDIKMTMKGYKTEMMRKVGADIVVATTEYERIL